MFVIAASMVYLVKRRRASQKSEMARTTSTSEHKEVTPIHFKKYGLQEMDGAGRALELSGQGFEELPEQSLQELDHPVPAVELQAYQHYHGD